MTHREALAHGEAIGSGYVLVPPKTTVTGSGGASIGRRSGGSLEFRDHRDYEPGDDLRHLDWSVLARSDRLAVKQFHEEISPFVDIVVDGSRSMALAESKKAETTLSLAALLAAASIASGFPYALSVARDGLRPVARGSARPTGWDEFAFDHAGSPAGAIVTGARSLRPKSIRFFLSDLLWEGEPLAVSQALAQGATAVVIIQILGTGDVSPQPRGGWRVLDVESGESREVYLDAVALAQYAEALVRHREMWDDAARQARAVVARCVAEEVGRQLVFDDLAAAEVLRPAWSRS
ncbi:MAG TPA: DUF58 domain-containing protein [Thermoanaerobaculia bacterium]|nr:DUF58 domain-containing protein [Thermoanaerobaculia bacterium]